MYTVWVKRHSSRTNPPDAVLYRSSTTPLIRENRGERERREKNLRCVTNVHYMFRLVASLAPNPAYIVPEHSVQFCMCIYCSVLFFFPYLPFSPTTVNYFIPLFQPFHHPCEYVHIRPLERDTLSTAWP